MDSPKIGITSGLESYRIIFQDFQDSETKENIKVYEEEAPKFHIGFDPYKKDGNDTSAIIIYKKDEDGDMIPVSIKKQRSKVTLKEDGKHSISGETSL